MCFRLFVASNLGLPLIPWNQEAPAFHAEPLTRHVSNVRDRFSLANVIEVGSHTNCSCGFIAEDEETSEEKEAREHSLSSFVSYLRGALDQGASVEVFLCWEGGEFETQAEKNLSLDQFFEPIFPLEEQELGHISA